MSRVKTVIQKYKAGKAAITAMDLKMAATSLPNSFPLENLTLVIKGLRCEILANNLTKGNFRSRKIYSDLLTTTKNIHHWKNLKYANNACHI